MLASFSSQHLESHLHDPGNPLYDSITKNHALIRYGHSLPSARRPRSGGQHQPTTADENQMSQKYDKLKTLLKEFFQMDQSDLDFGLYRVMHTKSAELSQIARRWSRPAESRQRQRRKRRFRRRGRCSRARGLKLEPPGLQLCWRDAGLCSRTAMPRTQFRQADNRLFLVSQRKSRRPGIPSAIGASAQKGETGPSSANASSQARSPQGAASRPASVCLRIGMGSPSGPDVRSAAASDTGRARTLPGARHLLVAIPKEGARCRHSQTCRRSGASPLPGQCHPDRRTRTTAPRPRLPYQRAVTLRPISLSGSRSSFAGSRRVALSETSNFTRSLRASASRQPTL